MGYGHVTDIKGRQNDFILFPFCRSWKLMPFPLTFQNGCGLECSVPAPSVTTYFFE
jgi:hypothetical protein